MISSYCTYFFLFLLLVFLSSMWTKYIESSLLSFSKIIIPGEEWTFFYLNCVIPELAQEDSVFNSLMNFHPRRTASINEALFVIVDFRCLYPVQKGLYRPDVPQLSERIKKQIEKYGNVFLNHYQDKPRRDYAAHLPPRVQIEEKAKKGNRNRMIMTNCDPSLFIKKYDICAPLRAADDFPSRNYIHEKKTSHQCEIFNPRNHNPAYPRKYLATFKGSLSIPVSW